MQKHAIAGVISLAAAAAFVSLAVAQTSEPKSVPAQAAPCAPAPSTAISTVSGVKRIYVDSFGDDAINKQIQAMVMSQLTATKRFIVTENKEKADAILRGAGLEKTSQESHAFNTGTAAGAASGYHSGSVSGHVVNGSGSISGSSSGGFSAASAAINDSYASTETINDARISVRLVNQEGDVIWATTQESKGAKYKGASADVAEKVVKQLFRDLEKAEQKPEDAASSVSK
jgi:curli biogenesis system outer membrane secretion channel CsgG